jgi:DNA helicase II / ATP-dependent DNA helicase PcrA
LSGQISQTGVPSFPTSLYNASIMAEADLLQDLNPEQKAAVTHGDGPLMIVAGAGTGKTTVITRRIAWLIDQKKARPEEILALTFTEKAATEMEERVDRLLPMGYVDLSISTFHAFCEKVLRAHGVHIGLPQDFKIATDVDSWLLMRRNLDRFALDYFRPRGNPTKFLRSMLQHFSRAKDEGITPEEYGAWVEDFVAHKSGGAPEAFAAMSDEDKLDIQKWQELARAYATYEQLLVEKSMLDFGSLMAYVLRLFLERPNVLKEYRERFKYVVVDEFQDTNTVQYRLVKLLVEPRRNITVVGDDDQAIYKFRGAALANILSFRSDFSDAAKIVLTSNYRSGKAILDGAYRLIQQNNPHRLESTEGLSKALRSHKDGEGFVRHVHCATLDDEVELTVREILELQKKSGGSWNEFCILVRANDASEPFLEALERAGVPYRFVAMSGLYTQPIVLDTLAYMRLARLPFDSPAAYRVLAHPRLGISESDLAELMMYVRRKGMPIIDAMRRSSEAIGVSLEGRGHMLKLLDIISQLQAKAKRKPVTEFFVDVLKDTGLLGDVSGLPEIEQQEVFRYLEGFLSRLKRFANANEDKGLASFLDEFDAEREAGEAGALKGDDQEGPDVVNVMTIHGAKGLEFRYVFVVNLIEQRFPSVSRSEALPLPPGLVSGNAELDDHVAEERRLFYVAMTRAKEGLFLMSAEDYGGTRKRKVSRFLTELGFDTPAVSLGSREVLTMPEATQTASTQILHAVPERISFSQVAAFTTCPLQYKYAHILKVPTFGRHSLSFGKSMHNTLQKFLEQVKNRQDATQVSLFGDTTNQGSPIPSVNELLDLFDLNFIDEWYNSNEEREDYRAQGKESLRKFHAQIADITPKVFGLEQGFTLKIGDVLVKGRIDRIDETPDGGLEIIDYKTGNPKSKLEWDDKRQLVLYALALEQCLPNPKPVKKLTYYYLTTNQTVSFEPTDKDRQKLTDQVIETMDRIAKSDFAPDPDPMKCKYCDFKDICPAAKF